MMRMDYHGVLIYKTEIQGAGVGSWIVLHVEDNSTRSLKNIVQLMGNVVNDLSGDSYSLQMMLTSSLLLLLVLELLLNKMLKQKKHR